MRNRQVSKSCPVLYLPGRNLGARGHISHGFEKPRDSKLTEISSFTFPRHRTYASSELRTRDHRNEVTGQSPRHGASRMGQTVRTDVCDFGATPPRSAPRSILRVRAMRKRLVSAERREDALSKYLNAVKHKTVSLTLTLN